MRHAHYSVVKVTDDTVWIADDNDGSLSVTNDAESVCRELHAFYGDRRFVYRDTDGKWDELLHEQGVFKDFAPAKPPE